MRQGIAVSLLVLLLVLLLGAQAKPTFDKLADALLNALDDEPHYYPRRPYAPAPPRGPLIEENYNHGHDHGYDYGYNQGYEYYYGGGGGHGVVVNRPYAQPVPVYGYHPAPVQAPTKGYYAPPAAASHHPHNYAPSGYSYGHTYGRTAATETESVGGYKQHGY